MPADQPVILQNDFNRGAEKFRRSIEFFRLIERNFLGLASFWSGFEPKTWKRLSNFPLPNLFRMYTKMNDNWIAKSTRMFNYNLLSPPHITCVSPEQVRLVDEVGDQRQVGGLVTQSNYTTSNQ